MELKFNLMSALLQLLMVENLVAKRAECEFKPMEGIEGNLWRMINWIYNSNLILRS